MSTMTFDAAVSALTGPGMPFELTPMTIGGVDQRVFKNLPATLPAMFAGSRQLAATTNPVFLVYEGERLTLADTYARVDALGAALVERYGIAKGDRVGIAMRNYPEWVISFMAIVSIGAISVSLNSWWTADELEYAIDDSGLRLLIVDRERLASTAASAQRHGVQLLAVRVEGNLPAGVDRWSDVVVPGAAMPVVDVQPDDDATILYTSGTTGHPKGAVSTHRAVCSAVGLFALRSTAESLRNPPPAEDAGNPTSFILIVPLFHVTGGVPVMLSCIATGMKLVIMYKWEVKRALELIQEERITNFVGVPAQGWDLINYERFGDYDTSSLRSIGGGGAPAPAAQVEKTAKAFPKGAPGIGYGMTETNAYGPQNTGADYVSHPTSAGRWVPPFEVRICDEAGNVLGPDERGEICFKGPNLIRGYWNRPEATATSIVDGWLRTGDVGRIDADGFVYVEDRVKDMILRGGENVYCAEVESAIYEHPAVREAAVFGLPHERLGEEVACTVLVQDGASLSVDELREFLSRKIAAFKIPAHVFLVDEALPRNAAGKFLKRELRDRYVR